MNLTSKWRNCLSERSNLLCRRARQVQDCYLISRIVLFFGSKYWQLSRQFPECAVWGSSCSWVTGEIVGEALTCDPVVCPPSDEYEFEGQHSTCHGMRRVKPSGAVCLLLFLVVQTLSAGTSTSHANARFFAPKFSEPLKSEVNIKMAQACFSIEWPIFIRKMIRYFNWF